MTAPSSAWSNAAAFTGPDDAEPQQVRALSTTIQQTMMSSSSRRIYSGLDFRKRATQKHRCIIHPRSRIRKWWDISILLVLFMNMVLVPLQLGFYRGSNYYWALYSLFSDVALFTDMVLNFRTGIHDQKQGIVITDPSEISRRYLRGWFGIDLLSSLPLDFFVWVLLSVSGLETERRRTITKLVKLISLVKLIKISRLFRYGGRTEQIMFYHTTGVYLQLVNIVALICLAVHWHACLQFFVGSMMGFKPESWISIADLEGKSWWEQYSWAVHNTMSLFMTNSYGLAVNTGLLVEVWIMVMGMFFGALWQALLLGYGANLLAHKDYTKNIQRERMQEVEEFMSYYDLPDQLRARIRSHVNAQRMYLNDQDILAALSGNLREDVLRHNYTATLTRVPFFAHADPEFTSAISERLKAEFFQPQDLVVRRGAMNIKVFFMRQGTANVTSEKGELLDTVTEGQYFGQSCLLAPKVRTSNVVAVSNCSILTLQESDFHDVLARFPELQAIFETVRAEIHSQEEAERQNRFHSLRKRRQSSVLILPELQRMGAASPSSESSNQEEGSVL